jgi:hypothetical protein
MPNYESNRNDWKDDCCCGSNKKDFKNDDCKFDHHKKDDCCCELNEKKYDDKYNNNHDCKCDDKFDKDKHHPEKKHLQCCCKLSMKKALELLGCDGIRENIDFNAFAFITDFFVVGSPLALLSGLLPEDIDNLAAELEGSLNRLPGCDCDTIDISGAAFYPIPLPVDNPVAVLTALLDALTALLPDIPALAPLIALLTAIIALGEAALIAIIDIIADLLTAIPSVDLASLCNLKAIVFQTLEGTVPGTTPPITRYQAVRQRFKCLLNECKKDDCKIKCEECCCNEGILKELAGGNITGTATLTAGSLALQGAEVLGSIDNVIVLGNEAERKIYFVCADAVSLMG